VDSSDGGRGLRVEAGVLAEGQRALGGGERWPRAAASGGLARVWLIADLDLGRT
jgi:hypothetical protein